jgi:4-aminobutyrate aminotransferase
VCLAAALATFDILEREAIANAAAVGSQMMERMKPWVSRYQNVGDVRGRGLMLGVEIVRDKESRAPAAPERDAIIQMAFERGLLLLGAGENTIRLSPALIVTGEEANAGLDILEACIEKTGLRP